MKVRKSKSNGAGVEEMVSIRISVGTKNKAEKHLSNANKKPKGRAIKIDTLLSLSLDIVGEPHIKMLQDQSLSNEDRKELLRQKYSEINGPVTRDEFTGVMMKPEFFEFLKEHGQGLVAA